MDPAADTAGATVNRRSINPPELFDSTRYGFAQAVAVTGGTTVHVSGQVAWDRDEAMPEGRDFASQVRGSFANLERVLEAAGGGLADVVALRLYIVEQAAGDLKPVGDAMRELFPAGGQPASTWLVVRGLADPGFLFEAEATAVIGPHPRGDRPPWRPHSR